MSDFPVTAAPEPTERVRMDAWRRSGAWARWGLLAAIFAGQLLAPRMAPSYPDLFLYPYTGAACLLAAGFCVRAAFRRGESGRMRWLTVAAAMVLQGATYFVAVANLRHSVSSQVDVLGRNITLAGSRVLLVSAMLVARTRSGRLVRGLDAALAVLACVLLTWALTVGEPAGGAPRVWVGFASLVMVLLAALTALPSSDTEDLQAFSQAMVGFVAVATFVNFTINILLYLWMNTDISTVGTLLMCVPALVLCEWSVRPPRVTPRRFPQGLDRNIVDSLQPTLMLLSCTMLGMFIVAAYPRTGLWSMLLAAALYAVRTQAFYYRLFRERGQLRMEASHLQQLAASDALTGIGNRRWFEQTAGALLEDDPSSRMAIVLVDADDFKDVNDQFGHFVGDELLRFVAWSLHDEVGSVPRACCARLGGDEFAALLPAVSKEQAEAVAEGLRAKVQRTEGLRVTAHSSVLQVGLTPSVSVGVAWVEGRRLSLSLMLRWADAALYRAKDDGRNCVRVIDLSTMADATNLDVADAVPKIGREPAPGAAAQA